MLCSLYSRMSYGIISGAKSQNYLLLITFAIVLWPILCRSQGNTTTPSTNPCDTSGTCGPFGVCSAQDSPICVCLQGFNPRNELVWNSGNWSSGCEREKSLNCNNGTTNDGFLKLQLTMMSDFSERWSGPEDQCEDRCLRNCACVAYGLADGGPGCRFWNGTLINIQRFSSNSGSYLYIRVSNYELERKKDSNKMIIILGVVGSVIVSICTCFCWKWFAKHRGKERTTELANVGTPGLVDTSLQQALGQVNIEDLPLFKFKILANATNDFSEANKLGKGGFGPVYKGKLENGKEIAVKMLSKASGQGMQEFVNEVLLISKLQHRNLVRLLGCSVENKEMLLVYEYMPNKSLDFFLFDPSQDILDWEKRFNIIEGICRGLLYLHRDSRLKIIHRDLKPSNILLDSDLNPKISDFGMARIYGTKQDHVSTVRVVGTYGYMAPEYAIEGRFSEKTDVFSFGVVMLEIATGKKNTSYNHQQGSLNLLGHTWNLWKEGGVEGMIDPRISNLRCQAEVMRCIHIGLLCVQELPLDRPSVSAVMSMLSSEIIELPEPKKPAFAVKTRRSEASTSSSQPSQKSSSSINNVTLTIVDGR